MSQNGEFIARYTAKNKVKITHKRSFGMRNASFWLKSHEKSVILTKIFVISIKNAFTHLI